MEGFNKCNANNTFTVSQEELDDNLYSDENRLFVTICLPIIAGLGILTNTAFLFTLYRVEGMRTTTNFYLGNLALSDLGYLIMLVRHTWTYFVLAPVENGTAWPTPFGCSAPAVITYAFYYSSVFLVTLVTLERYIAICHPLKYRNMDRKTRAVKLVALSWILSIGLAMFEASPTTIYTECYKLPDHDDIDDTVVINNCEPSCRWCPAATIIIDTVQFVLSFTINFIMYVLIVKTLNSREIAKTGSEETARRIVQTRNRVARMLAVNSALFFVCLSPYELINIEGIVIEVFGGPEFLSVEVLASLGWIGRILSSINSSVNPIVYSVTNPDYRLAFLEAIGLRSASSKDKTSIKTISSRINDKSNVNV